MKALGASNHIDMAAAHVYSVQGESVPKAAG